MAAVPAPLKKSAGASVNADIAALLRARHTLLWIVSREELRVERGLLEAAAAARFGVKFWDCATGIADVDGKVADQRTKDPDEALAWIADAEERTVFILRDFHKWVPAPGTNRRVRSMARDLQSASPEKARVLVILSPSGDVPPELANHATVIDYPIPDRQEIAKLLADTVASLPEEMRASAAPQETMDEAIDSAVGLSAEEAGNCYALSVVKSRKIDPGMVANEKKRVIAREKVLTWYDPDPRGIDAIGGLDELKRWLSLRHLAFSPEARAFGLPAPKGMMLVGVPGAGKSLTAKCIASAWKMPLLRLDMGALKSKFVGDSEANIRRALKVAEAVAPCVLWLDEIEKSLAGSTGAQGDGGVSADALGAILSWMQERVGAVFVVATANDVTSLPPELLRKGRFDEMFFVDLPTLAERVEILKVSLKPRSLPDADVLTLATATPNFTGAELASIIPEALFRAFADGARALTVDDLLEVSKSVVPLATTAADKIGKLREWAKDRCRMASRSTAIAQQVGRKLDL